MNARKFSLAWSTTFVFLTAPVAGVVQANQTALASPARDAAPIRIGVNCPFSGGSSDMGESMRSAMRLIVRELNDVGGIFGQPVELIERDDQAKPDIGKQVAQDLVNAGVVLTIGYCNTGVAAASIDVYQKAKVPLIIPVATGTQLTQTFRNLEGDPNYIFRTSVPDAIQVDFMVEQILKRGLDKVAILADKTLYGTGGVNDVVAALAKRNLKPVAVERFDIGVKDLKAELQRARAAGANVIYTYTVGPENAVISRSREQLKWNVQHVGSLTVGFGSHLKAGGPAAEGALMPQTFIEAASYTRDRATFVRKVRKELQAEHISCAMCAAQAYDAMQIALSAIAQARLRVGNITHESVRNQLESLDHVVRGVITAYERPYSRRDHDAVTGNMLVLGEVRGGVVRFANREDELKTMIPERKIHGAAPAEYQQNRPRPSDLPM
jgi:branched-chain amino acid transport system substrate-binding protein